MPKSKYGKYVVTELKTPPFSPEVVARYNAFAKRILWMDSNIVPGAFQMNESWYYKPQSKPVEPHAHDVDEIIGFFSGDYKRQYDLGGQIEFWLEDQQFILDKSTLIFVPAGMVHCPLKILRVDRPIFHFSVVTGNTYVQGPKIEPKKTGKKYDKYVVQELKMPPDKVAIAKEYNKYARRILWMDKDVVPGAFNMNTAWYLKETVTLENVPHTHTNDEIIGFFGSDPNNPSDLGGEIEIWMENEKQVITKSAMIFVPAGLKHCPLILKRVDRPIFHFTVVTSGRYIKDEKQK